MTDIEEIIQKNLDAIVNFAHELRDNPELGFEEYKSSAIVRKHWESIGLQVRGPFANTGLKAYIEGEACGAGKGPSVCLICELDAVASPGNPIADSHGIAHACGHYIQTSQVFAAAFPLMKLKKRLCGRVILMAVPAEEFLQIEKRIEMRKAGKLGYLSGKPELMRLGVMDDVDMAIMLHAHPCTPDHKLFLEGGNLGFTAKNIRFSGRAAHGAVPFEGRNALQAAMLFINGVNANRETFRDEESMRIHPIVTKGGSVVNSIPDDVRIETYVRGSSREAINKGCAVVDRCADAAAMMMGCTAQMQTIPGYLPLRQDANLSRFMKKVASKILGDGMIGHGVASVGSTDMGDLSHIMPVIQPTMGGFKGELHSAEFEVVDEARSCLLGGALLAELAVCLLDGRAENAREVIDGYKPLMTREQYYEYLDNH